MTVNEEANPDRAVKFGTGKVEIAVTTLTELLEVTDQFADALGDLDPDSELDGVLKRLRAVTTSAVLPHVIDTLERNGGPGRTLPYLLEYSIGRRLEEPADRPGTNSHELNDRLYLRWLAHRTIDVDEATEAEFLRRWTARQEELNSASH
ncbi:hypothetical protein [Rhodococcus qingshengii]|uniref:hypothetical protein n=1 Tax=Rhodococcus qingshengii TaxID=334542 RepID=UPI00237CF627|nr:hypothetical protein [Rhodococcus qingshengii]WCT06113.1 hypothetical protein PI247_31430 [Rhodococcus qingshengii]